MRGDASGLRDSNGVSVSILEWGRQLGEFGAGTGEVCLLIFCPRLLQLYVPLKGKTGEPKSFPGSPPRLQKPSRYSFSELVTCPACCLSLSFPGDAGGHGEFRPSFDAPCVPSKDKQGLKAPASLEEAWGREEEGGLRGDGQRHPGMLQCHGWWWRACSRRAVG